MNVTLSPKPQGISPPLGLPTEPAGATAVRASSTFAPRFLWAPT